MKPRYRPIRNTVMTSITPKGTAVRKGWYRANIGGVNVEKPIRRERPLPTGVLTKILKREVIQLNEIQIARTERAVKGSIVLVGDSLGRVTSVSGNKANIVVTHNRNANPMTKSNAVYAKIERPELRRDVNLNSVAAIGFKIKATDFRKGR